MKNQMKSQMKISMMDWVERIIRWSLGAIFIGAGCIKLLAPVNFAVLIEAYGIVPEPLLMPLAVILPAIEVIAGTGLLFNIEGSRVVIIALIALFMAILGYGIGMGLDVDCGCFGPGDPEAAAYHGLKQSLWRDLMMLVAVLSLHWWHRHHGIEPLKIGDLTDKLSRKRSKKDAYV